MAFGIFFSLLCFFEGASQTKLSVYNTYISQFVTLNSLDNYTVKYKMLLAVLVVSSIYRGSVILIIGFIKVTLESQKSG